MNSTLKQGETTTLRQQTSVAQRGSKTTVLHLVCTGVKLQPPLAEALPKTQNLLVNDLLPQISTCLQEYSHGYALLRLDVSAEVEHVGTQRTSKHKEVVHFGGLG